MRKYIVFLLVLSAALAPTFVGTLAAQAPYQPMIAKIVEVSTPAVPAAGAMGDINLIVGDSTREWLPCTGGGCPFGPFPFDIPYVTGIAPAFPALVLGCGSVVTAPALAQYFSSGVNIQSGGVSAGYTATAFSGTSRVQIVGPPNPNANQEYDWWINIYHSEIHPTYGHLLEPWSPVVNLCDGVSGNEWGSYSASNGLGFDAKFVTLSEDPVSIGSFESVNGFVVPPNWKWNGSGQVSVEPGGFLATGTSGFPTTGNNFLRISTEGLGPMSQKPPVLVTTFKFNPATPILRLTYRWFNGEGGVNLASNDMFVASVNGTEVVHEDTTTPLSAGTRTVEFDVREAYWGNEYISLSFWIWDAYSSPAPSIAFVDDISFAAPGLGEGNNVYPFGPQFRLSTMTWDIVRGPSQMSSADKRLSPTGILLFQEDFNQQLPLGTGSPFFIVGSFVPYGAQPLYGLPGEPDTIGLDIFNLTLVWQGVWGNGYPMIPYFMPPGIVVDGFYVQAAIVDLSAPNGLGMSNRVRHRLE